MPDALFKPPYYAVIFTSAIPDGTKRNTPRPPR
jgi:hypothetical protein